MPFSLGHGRLFFGSLLTRSITNYSPLDSLWLYVATNVAEEDALISSRIGQREGERGRIDSLKLEEEAWD